MVRVNCISEWDTVHCLEAVVLNMFLIKNVLALAAAKIWIIVLQNLALFWGSKKQTFNKNGQEASYKPPIRIKYRLRSDSRFSAIGGKRQYTIPFCSEFSNDKCWILMMLWHVSVCPCVRVCVASQSFFVWQIRFKVLAGWMDGWREIHSDMNDTTSLTG